MSPISEFHAAILQALVTAGVAAVCWYLYASRRQATFLWWSVAWSLYVQEEPSNFGDPAIYLSSARGIVNGDGYHLLFSTHPTTDERVARLTAMAGELGQIERQRPWGSA